MNKKKLGTIVVLILLTPGISWIIPNVAGAGKEKSLVERVKVLEEQVALLTARVETLEQGGGACDTFDVVHLTPLATCPSDPIEGDLCVMSVGGSNSLFSYLNGSWWHTPHSPHPFTCP